MHYAVSHQTAAEIVYNRTDSEKQNMGLTTWKNSPNGKILETDVKNPTYIIYLVLFYIFQILSMLYHRRFRVIFYQHLLIYLYHLIINIYLFYLPNHR